MGLDVLFAFANPTGVLPTDPLGPGAGLVAAMLAGALLALPTHQLLRRTGAVGSCTSVIGGAVATGLAALLGALTGVPIVLWIVIVALCLWGAAFVDWRRRGLVRCASLGEQWVRVVGTALPMVPAVWLYWLAPVEWDARSIWFSHASWMAVPDVAYHSIVETPIHHPTYPPLTPSFGAFSLLFGDNRNDWILQAATSLLLVAALGVVVLGLIDGCPSAGRHERWFHAVAAAFASSVLLGPLLRWGFTGYVDALVSVLTASVLVVGLTSGDRRTLLVLGLALGLTKPEAPVFLLLVLVPLLALWRRPIAPLLPGFAASAGWFLVMKARGAESIGWRVGEALPGSAAFISRSRLIADTFAAQAALRAAFTFWVGALFIVMACRLLRGKLAGNDLWFLLTGGVGAVGLSVILVGTYLATPFDLSWHLATSIDRVVLAPAILLMSSAVGALLMVASGLVAAHGGASRAASAPETQ